MNSPNQLEPIEKYFMKYKALALETTKRVVTLLLAQDR